ncbi:MAG TPA: calcium/sodium antiporter [Methanothermobacter sp.]|nr:cation antiporter [Methanothermobacter sp. MT-2]HHW04591.1 calcium/sodium antiporter [Methanothermobacter sp.]HOK72055.1 calcium/sodium antiporter [Methanothermobacter sp.]HOL68368.1 calcium/sodium antiporter [Methanothermobacter sp.]HPQ04126.1 calcium/sodium antiporter [Methanothermobacter sp.]
MIVEVILVVALVISLIIVIKSANVFVDNLVEIGGVLGISEIILGVTASAIGTSLPEFGSAVIASLSESTAIGVGCVIGSNIWNIAGILGISAIVAGKIGTEAAGLKRDFTVTLLTAVILVLFMLLGDIGRVAAFFMILVYLIYFWRLIKAQKDYNMEHERDGKRRKLNPKIVLLTVLGFAGLVVGCRILVYTAVELARIMGVPEMIMGLFTLAIGTSIPELVVTLSSAIKGLHHLSLGTVLGSNTFNILIGIGIPALIKTIPVDPLSLRLDAPVMIIVTILLVLLIKQGNMKLKRSGGIILFAVYILYAFIRLYGV